MNIRVAAPAKVNLSLHITGRRSDGFHLIDSLVAFASLADKLEIASATGLSLEVAGEFAPALAETATSDNLVLRAARALQREAGIHEGAHITLHKYIPVGAGLGGGSADAATALCGLARLWHIAPDDALLTRLAGELGSDVPVCIASQTAWMSGVGELLQPCRLDAAVGCLLVNPRQPLLTKDVFGHYSRHLTGRAAPPATRERPGSIGSVMELVDRMRSMHNALEPSAIHLLPVIGDMLACLRDSPGCRIARMSGSGATCFGLYDTYEDAAVAAQAIRGKSPHWWLAAVTIGDNRSEHGKTQ